MVIAEALAGIALVKGAVNGIKSAISTAQDISDIAHHIDNLFKGEQEIQQQRNKASKDPFSVYSVAEETINAKLAQEQMTEMKNLINMRFGAGVWEGIIAERARRIQEQKEFEKEQRAAKRKKREHFIHNAKIAGWVSTGVSVIILILVVALSAIAGTVSR